MRLLSDQITNALLAVRDSSESEFLEAAAQALREVATSHRAMGAWLVDNRKKGAKSLSERHEFAAEQLEILADDLVALATGGAPAAGEAPRCASFRRATPDDQTLCTLERGHGGDHMSDASHLGPHVWPRRHSGVVCGDVIGSADRPGVTLNCELPLGHDGDQHWSAGYLWPRGVNPRPVVEGPRPLVAYPGMATHGEPVAACDSLMTEEGPRCSLGQGHPGLHQASDDSGTTWEWAIAQPTLSAEERAAMTEGAPPVHVVDRIDSVRDVSLATDPLPGQEIVSVTAVPEPYDGQCASTEGDDRCMLPGAHTGRHTGRQGSWARAEPAAIDAAGTEPIVVPVQREPVAAEQIVREAEQIVSGALESMVPAAAGGVKGAIPWPGFTPPEATPIPVPTPVAALAALSFATSGELPRRPLRLDGHTPRAHQSVSSINTMSDCGLKYRFTYHDKLPETPAWWNVGGTAGHETIRMIEGWAASGQTVFAPGPGATLLEQQQEAGKLYLEQLEYQACKVEAESGKPRSTWRAANKGSEGEEFWRTKGDDFIRSYVAQRADWLAEWQLVRMFDGNLAQEVEFLEDFGGVAMKGYIDSVWRHRTDPSRVAVVDYKFGRDPGDSFQLDTYGEVLTSLPSELFGAQGLKVEGRYYMARKGTHTAAEPLGGKRDLIAYRAQATAAADAAGIFLPRVSTFCNSCPFRAQCPVVK